MALNHGHYNTAFLPSWRHTLAEVCRAREVVFTVNGEDLEGVSVFKYLGRPISASDADYPAAYYNLKKARKRWARVSRVLTREGADPRVYGMF